MTLREEADMIIKESIDAVLPDTAVKNALKELPAYKGNLYLIAIGKAAWQMAHAAEDYLGDQIHSGIVITKYGHAKGALPHVACFEAGHPIPDGNGFAATKKAIDLVNNLSEDDLVLFLISGGGSALFEWPLIESDELISVTDTLLSRGANITEMNTIRKRLSAVKGGRFANICAPAKIFSIVLSDIVGDPLDMIASGPAYPDSSTVKDALQVAKKYKLPLSDKALDCLKRETTKTCPNVTTHITGSVKLLCQEAANICGRLGYEPMILSTSLSCEAKKAGVWISRIAISEAETRHPLAFIAGGETVVHLSGKGLGGRNQEIALTAAERIAGQKNIAIFSVGSDGTDGPTDAAGGYVDGDSFSRMENAGIRVKDALKNNDSFHALKACDGLIVTGPTGTNVNDLTVALVRCNME